MRSTFSAKYIAAGKPRFAELSSALTWPKVCEGEWYSSCCMSIMSDGAKLADYINYGKVNLLEDNFIFELVDF